MQRSLPTTQKPLEQPPDEAYAVPENKLEIEVGRFFAALVPLRSQTCSLANPHYMSRFHPLPFGFPLLRLY